MCVCVTRLQISEHSHQRPQIADRNRTTLKKDSDFPERICKWFLAVCEITASLDNLKSWQQQKMLMNRTLCEKIHVARVKNKTYAYLCITLSTFGNKFCCIISFYCIKTANFENNHSPYLLLPPWLKSEFRINGIWANHSRDYNSNVQWNSLVQREGYLKWFLLLVISCRYP